MVNGKEATTDCSWLLSLSELRRLPPYSLSNKLFNIWFLTEQNIPALPWILTNIQFSLPNLKERKRIIQW